MHHVQHFKANFDPPAQMAPTGQPVDDMVDHIQYHERDRQTQNLCFVWEDGRRIFLNYAYLVLVDLTVQNNINVLVLSFGSYTVTLKGYHLGLLFDLLMYHVPKVITASNPRYYIDGQTACAFIIEILVKSE